MTRAPVSASIIICTRNRAASLRKTLAAMGTVAIPEGWVAEVLIVDNASNDDTASVAESARLPNMGCRYLLEPRGGKGYALNSGLAAATGQIIAFTDDDVAPTHDWLSALCTPIAKDAADAVVGPVELAPHLKRPWITPLHRGWLASTENDTETPPRMVGANMAFSRRVLEQVPSFDTELGPGRLGFGEDTLFGLQLIAAGYRVVRSPDARVTHHFDPDRLTRASFLATAVKQGKTEAYLDRHWRHQKLGFPQVRALGAMARLTLWRAGRPWQLFRKEGAAPAEMYWVSNLARRRHYQLESGRPAAYEPGGLIKKTSQEHRN